MKKQKIIHKVDIETANTMQGTCGKWTEPHKTTTNWEQVTCESCIYFFRLADEELKLLEDEYEECEFKAEGNREDCSCGLAKKGDRIWFHRSSPEHSDGDYYCDFCGFREIIQKEKYFENYNVLEVETGGSFFSSQP